MSVRMDIVRNGLVFSLTEEEIFKAYEIQKFEFAKENIVDNMRDFLGEEEYSLLKDNDDFINKVAASFQNFENKGFSYEYSIENACKLAAKSCLIEEQEEER